MLRSIQIAAFLLVGLFATGRAAGVSEPMLIRSVVLSGATGSAYYSVIEQGYRFINGVATARSPGAPSHYAEGDAGRSNAPIDVSSLDSSRSGLVETVMVVDKAR